MIARLKGNKKISPPSNPTPTPTPTPVAVVEEKVEEIAPELTLAKNPKPVEEVAPTPTPVAVEQPRSREEQMGMEIEMLQNNGRFRVELLHQMQEINKALVGIAEIMVDLNGKK